jgi:hypothetical protein
MDAEAGASANPVFTINDKMKYDLCSRQSMQATLGVLAGLAKNSRMPSLYKALLSPMNWTISPIAGHLGYAQIRFTTNCKPLPRHSIAVGKI